LINIINQTNRRGSLLWEFPKGRPKLMDRNNYLISAMREVREETGIGKEDYHILSGITKNVVIVSGNFSYDIKYYVAVAGEELEKKNNFEMNYIHDNEVQQIQWKPIEEIRRIDTIDKKIERIIRDIFSICKLYFNMKFDVNKANILNMFESAYNQMELAHRNAILIED
jgi:8-oxo-dGTP pyrophosphatase MutT (NUDIX family)